MKKYIIIIIISNLFTYAQEGVVLPFYHPTIKLINGTYEKDIDNVFSPYIGTWAGNQNGKELKLKIVKNTKRLKSYVNGDYHYRDRLVIFIRITDLATGDFISDNLEEADNALANIFSVSTPYNNKFKFLFIDDIEGHCSKSTGITFKGDPATNQLLFYSSTDSWFETLNCSYGSIEEIPDILPITTPATPIALTRL